MNINVLNVNYEKIAIVDDFTSLMWCQRFNDVGALDLEIEATKSNLDLFKKGYFITRDDDDTIFRIEIIELETSSDGNDRLIIGGIDCKCLLNQRITWKQVFLNNSDVQTFIRKMITDNFISPTDNNRKMNIVFDTNTALNGIGRVTTRQSTYDDIGQKTIELCKNYDLGLKVYFENDNFHVKLFQGVDRSHNQIVNPQIIFSTKYDNLFSSKYDFDMSESKNVALVGGEGEGVDRKLRSVGDAIGIERREVFIDASSSNDSADLVDYYDSLINEGKDKLAELNAKTSFECDVDTTSLIFKTHYNIGDIVTIENRYGVIASARVIEVIETWDESGYTLEPVFEYFEPVVNMKRVLFTESFEALFTEDKDILILDNAEIITENNISMITEDNILIIEEDY